MRPTAEWLNQPGGLAERLEQLRRSAGLTGVQLARALGWAQSKVPKLENGRQMPTEADVRAWAQVTGQPGAAGELLELLADAQIVRRQWKHQLSRGHAALQAEYDALVRGAKRIRSFQIAIIPGLLQTPGYARSMIEETVRLHGTDPGGTDAAVTARLRRGEVLYDPGKTFGFCVTEAALRLLPCPPGVMAAQLDRLMTVTALGNVTLGVIPFGAELTIMPRVGFLTVDDLTIVEAFTAGDAIPGAESARYDEIFDMLMAEAVTGEDARRLIAAAAAALRA